MEEYSLYLAMDQKIPVFDLGPDVAMTDNVPLWEQEQKKRDIPKRVALTLAVSEHVAWMYADRLQFTSGPMATLYAWARGEVTHRQLERAPWCQGIPFYVQAALASAFGVAWRKQSWRPNHLWSRSTECQDHFRSVMDKHFS